MSVALECEDDSTALAEHVDRQLRYYERDKVACQLKICCILQAVRTALIPHHPPTCSGPVRACGCCSLTVRRI
jgi:hypothetical protein